MAARGSVGKASTPRNDTLDKLVVALCADYERRENALLASSVGKRVAMEYRYINSRIYDAVSEIVGAAEAETYINEIGKNIGYAHSEVAEISDVSYKRRKKEVKLNIARKMHLND